MDVEPRGFPGLSSPKKAKSDGSKKRDAGQARRDLAGTRVQWEKESSRQDLGKEVLRHGEQKIGNEINEPVRGGTWLKTE